MIILAGASASGKTEVGKELSKHGFEKLITYTTRDIRKNEIDGIDYHFISKEDFLKLKNNDFFFETVCYNDNYYGTAKEDIQMNKYVILEPAGLKKYKNSQYFTKSFLFDVKENVRFERMKKRGDNIDNINKRIVLDRTYFNDEIKNNIDYIIDNNDDSIENVTNRIIDLYNR